MPSPALAADPAQLTEAILKLVAASQEATKPAVYPDHADAIEPWKKAMATGVFSGRPFSNHTVENYERYALYFMKTYGNLSYGKLEDEFSKTPVDMFGRKDKFYRAIVCFAKFLERHHSLENGFLERVKTIKPKRHKPPKRHTLTEEQLKRLYAAADDPQNYLMIKLLATTGLRASECCQLAWSDVDLEQGVLTVALGKGGKRRRVGLCDDVIQLLAQHLHKRPPLTHPQVFYDKSGNPMRRDGLLNRIYRIGRLAGVHATPHALRRAFVTLNANKGRSLVMLQVACGHSDIKTTRSYCQTTEDEVIEAMKGWS